MQYLDTIGDPAPAGEQAAGTCRGVLQRIFAVRLSEHRHEQLSGKSSSVSTAASTVCPAWPRLPRVSGTAVRLRGGRGVGRASGGGVLSLHLLDGLAREQRLQGVLGARGWV